MHDVSELMMVGLPGIEVTREIRDFLKGGVGGVILFTRNFKNCEQLRAFTSELNEAAGKKLIMAVDQEGGRVMRLREGFTPVPPMSEFGRSGDVRALKDIAETMAGELSSVGINFDFAPVADVLTNPKNPVIGDRAFSSEPAVVARLCAVFIEAMQGCFVATCAKHFPGHGDTELDSHEATPVVDRSRELLDACELIPFRAAIEAGVSSVMTAHIVNRSIDSELPATVSEAIIGGILRTELAFDGLVITDDLTMKGLSSLYPPHRAACMAISAGADIVLECSPDLKIHFRVREELKRAADRGYIPADKISGSLARIDIFRKKFVEKT
jgi:beta-N-acetylhexosaminidase